MHSVKLSIVAAGALLIGATAYGASYQDDVKRLNESTAVLGEIRVGTDNGIPDSIWSKAECVVVIPSMKKAAFIIGGEFGSGVMSCKTGNRWGAPVFMELARGSAGFQIGAQSTDLVLVVMNRRGVEKLLSNKVTLGTDASIAAGPIGRMATAATDAQMTAEMLSYSRSRGLFAGIDLSGGTLKPDNSANSRMYGANVSARDVALGMRRVSMITEARAFTNALRNQQAVATSGKK
ncbi:MAG TPA: lipid-binding SYLF domain-containing protein [Vicinamibacterales bacterium]|nr:lipid-binding SYLF domain-containing protein [Vicinamibacterales bacterium]